MTEDDIKQIEDAVGSSLPAYYTATMLKYPFPIGSFADEFLLMTDRELILKENRHADSYPGIGKPFLIGCDGGEEVYFIDLTSSLSEVFVYDMERASHRVQAKDWPAYLDQVQATLKEIADDERALAQRKANKRWWEFWK